MSDNREKLIRLLAVEDTAMVNLKATSSAKKLAASRQRLLNHIKEVAKSGDLQDMISTEKEIITNDLERHSNSTIMEGSLKAAINEMSVIQKHLAIVDDPQKYKAVDEAHSLPKNRQRGLLPLDEARQGFKSHFVRLVNMDKSRLDDDEKKIIDARKSMISTVQKLYMARQANTLGVDIDQNKKQSLKH